MKTAYLRSKYKKALLSSSLLVMLYKVNDVDLTVVFLSTFPGVNSKYILQLLLNRLLRKRIGFLCYDYVTHYYHLNVRFHKKRHVCYLFLL